MKYPFFVFQTQVEDHIFWIAKSAALKGCVGQGETQEEAITELEGNEMEWLDTAREVGIPIPEIPIETMQEYSGKLTLRISPAVHKQASSIAKQEGISLNQYINDAIVARNSELTTAHYISKQVTSIVDRLSGRFLRYESISSNEAVVSLSLINKKLYSSYAASC